MTAKGEKTCEALEVEGDAVPLGSLYIESLCTWEEGLYTGGRREFRFGGGLKCQVPGLGCEL